MKLNTIILAIAAVFTVSEASAVQSYLTDGIADYVYPNNAAKRPPSFTYAPDGNGYLMLSSDGTTIDRYDMRTGQKLETLFSADNTRESKIKTVEGFEISDNGRYLLVYTDAQSIYRRSFTARYYVYEVRTRLLKPLSDNFERQRAPMFSPDGRMVAFVATDNNIYIKKLDYNSQVAVTKDGAVNKIINGVPDWVYEEEFTTSRSMVWAPDNLSLCYIKYDETDVPLYSLPIYQGTCNPRDQYALYPGVYTYKYPVAGEKNSRVTVHAYDVEKRDTKDIVLSDTKIEYIPRIEFGGSADRLMISTLNRNQTRLEIYSANPRSTVVKSVYVDECTAWIQEESYTSTIYTDDYFVVMSSKSGYNHYYQYTYAGVMTKALTSGNYDATDFYGFDAKGNMYYQAALPSPLDRTIYRVDAKGRTEAITAEYGTNTAQFAPDMSIAMMMHSDVNTPPCYTVNTPDGKPVRVLEDNSAMTRKCAGLPTKEFFTFDSDGYKLNGYIIRPAGASATNKCPVIMYQYSGPGSQTVLNRWSLDWEQYYAKQGYAIVCVDGRGTGGRGRAFMDVVYKNLGHYETIDQVNAAKYAASLDFTDASSIGIFGWSYGGYEALMAASAQGAPYAAAVAVAPVTDWRYYDSVYTERFMLTPQQNDAAYVTSAPINRVGDLVCPLLIMYGTSDDNVHPVNSLQYVSTLQSAGGYCDMLVFPNMNHSIYGCNARAVVYAKMLDYFNEKLK